MYRDCYSFSQSQLRQELFISSKLISMLLLEFYFYKYIFVFFVYFFKIRNLIIRVEVERCYIIYLSRGINMFESREQSPLRDKYQPQSNNCALPLL